MFVCYSRTIHTLTSKCPCLYHRRAFAFEGHFPSWHLPSNCPCLCDLSTCLCHRRAFAFKVILPLPSKCLFAFAIQRPLPSNGLCLRMAFSFKRTLYIRIKLQSTPSFNCARSSDLDSVVMQHPPTQPYQD